MKQLKQLTLVMAITLMLSATAFAGDIEIGKTSTPPPPAASSATPGGVETPGGASAASQADYSATNVAFDLLQAVLTMF